MSFWKRKTDRRVEELPARITFTIERLEPGYGTGWTEAVIVDGTGKRRTYSFYTERVTPERIAARLRSDLDWEAADAQEKGLVGKSFTVPRNKE